jgi:hypothetical protein
MENFAQSKYSISIPINRIVPQKSPKSFDDNIFTNKQYSLTNNCFDPTKSSPPNIFLKNLELRMSIYNSEKK